MDKNIFKEATVLATIIDKTKRQIEDWKEVDPAKNKYYYSKVKFSQKGGVEFEILIEEEDIIDVKKLLIEKLQFRLTDLENKFKKL